jgi:hypothetical protein
LLSSVTPSFSNGTINNAKAESLAV